jgi:D-cysteine desulfhydrase family pyridoxal phosphate-dependent enzyme
MDAAALRARLSQFPRLALATYPTPLERLNNFSRSLTADLWMKRDDTIGPALGGNKTRKLEFLMADAQRRGARKVVTYGGLQSNHARITAAVARQLGMEPHLFYFEKRPRARVGNLQLNALMNAQMHFIPFGGGGINDLRSTNRLVRLLSLAMVGPSYFIPVGGHNALGCLGYVACAAELAEQVQSLDLPNAIVVTAVGTGGTLAGLVAGFTLLDSRIRVIGIDVGKLWKALPTALAQLTTQICALLGESHRFTAREIPMLEDRYVGLKYGVPSLEGNIAIGRVAEEEGIFLDPVYTGKAMAGTIDLMNRGFFKSDETAIFLHTGGVPGLFAFPYP